MKYYEILVTKNKQNSYYEGRFFIEDYSKVSAVNKVKQLLEITGNEFDFYIKELTLNDYNFNINLAEKRNSATKRMLKSYYKNGKIDNKTNKNLSDLFKLDLELIDLRAY